MQAGPGPIGSQKQIRKTLHTDEGKTNQSPPSNLIQFSRNFFIFSSIVDDDDDDDPLHIWILQQQNNNEEEEEFDEQLDELARLCQKRAAEEQSEQPRKRNRSCKKVVMEVFDENGNRHVATPKQTPWYLFYVLFPSLEKPKFHKKFRHRFRLPYAQFKELLDDVKKDDHFKQWHVGSADATKASASPIELLVLGTLRYLGRGWTFDDLEEATAIGEETHRQFFHKFLEYGSTTLFKRHVRFPKTPEEAKTHMGEMEKAGCHGCAGSMDAVHIMM
jgi:hypothetical protein